MDPRLIGCGLSAAAALGLPLPVEVASALLARRPDLRLRGTNERTIKLRGGPRLATVERVVVEAAQVLPMEWGLAVADAAVAFGFTIEERLRSADVPRGSRGARSARWVLDHVQAEVESPLESLARAVTEADGKVKYGGEDKVTYGAKGTYGDDDKRNPLWREKTREDALRDEDYEVVRFTMADYYHQRSWISRYTQAQSRARRRRAGQTDRRE